MYFDPLEALAARYDNVILRDRAGNPSVFVRFEKCLSSDLDPSLPAHVHPAFIIDGKERDYILIGKYKAGEAENTGTRALYSLPNTEPKHSLSVENAMPRMRAAGPGVSCMTIADYGFLKLLAQKLGWEARGNNRRGMSEYDGKEWTTGANYAAGVIRGHNGWLYECLEAHVSAADTRPDHNPRLWKRKKFVGGVWNGKIDAASYQTGHNTLNGTGPAEWYLGNDARSVADLIGSHREYQAGYRVVGMELQVLENNDAADPEADMSAGSGAWRAILPHSADDGYDLVAPGTAGTLHWNWTGSAIQLDTQCDDMTVGQKSTLFSQLTAHATRLPYVPCIVKELGLFPTDGDTTGGTVSMAFMSVERLCWRGVPRGTNSAGLGSVAATQNRDYVTNNYGFRTRAMES